MFRIKKTFSFSASHRLTTLPPEHQCARLHGHNYKVRIELQSAELDAHGFVVDYGDLKPFKELIDSRLDHRHLNDTIPVEPTAERLALWLFRQAKQMWPETSCVAVSETDNTWAEYREDQ